MSQVPIYITEALQVFFEDNNFHVVLGTSSGCQNEAGKDLPIEAIRFTISSQRFDQLIQALSEARGALLGTNVLAESSQVTQPELTSNAADKQPRMGEPLVFSFGERRSK